MIPSSMSGEQLVKWRRQMGWTQPFAAQKLGICIASLQSYERGRRSDKDNPILIPLLVAWAVSAIAAGLSPYGGKLQS